MLAAFKGEPNVLSASDRPTHLFSGLAYAIGPPTDSATTGRLGPDRAIQPSAPTTRWKEVKHMDLDDLFEGDLVVGVPPAIEEYHRKAPGHQDSNGDHCQD